MTLREESEPRFQTHGTDYHVLELSQGGPCVALMPRKPPDDRQVGTDWWLHCAGSAFDAPARVLLTPEEMIALGRELMERGRRELELRAGGL